MVVFARTIRIRNESFSDAQYMETGGNPMTQILPRRDDARQGVSAFVASIASIQIRCGGISYAGSLGLRRPTYRHFVSTKVTA